MNVLACVLFLCVSLLGLASFCATSCRLAYTLSTQEPTHDIIPDYFDDHTDREFIRRWLTNGLLLLTFILQHSGMATGFWKDFLSALGLGPIERGLYILGTSAALQVLLQYWEPLTATPLWHVDTGSRDWLWLLFAIVHAGMWTLLACGLLLTDLPELLGLKQVYYYARDWSDPLHYKSLASQKLLSNMRHTGALLMLVVLWVHPVMSLGRFLLALNWTLYLLLGQSITVSDYQEIEEHVIIKRVLISEQTDMNE